MIMTNNIQVSLTDFVDFMCKTGKSKISQVKAIKKKQNSPYSVAKDFYKPLRDGIINLHKLNKNFGSLDTIWRVATDKKKQTAYPTVIAGYKRFLRGKDVTWINQPKAKLWTYRNLEIRINPELCLTFGGSDHVIKLYFKKDRLSENHALSINHLMQTTLGNGNKKRSLGVLDVRKGVLVEELPVNGEFARLVREAAAEFLRLYYSV